MLHCFHVALIFIALFDFVVFYYCNISCFTIINVALYQCCTFSYCTSSAALVAILMLHYMNAPLFDVELLEAALFIVALFNFALY